MGSYPSLYGLSQSVVVVGLATCGLLVALMGGPTSGPVVAVFPPWWDGLRAVDAAAEAGAVLRFGVLDFIVVVAPEEPHSRDRLWRAGAWILFNPRGLSGCGPGTGVKSSD
jgi:hypothetical protein